MFFKRSTQRYGRTLPPERPYQRAGQLWDELIGSARVQARNWRLIAFGCLFLTSGTSAGLAWQSLQSRVTPYVVEVDRLGEARAVQPADVEYRPTDRQVAWHLAWRPSSRRRNEGSYRSILRYAASIRPAGYSTATQDERT